MAPEEFPHTPGGNVVVVVVSPSGTIFLSNPALGGKPIGAGGKWCCFGLGGGFHQGVLLRRRPTDVRRRKNDLRRDQYGAPIFLKAAATLASRM
jgi:hypothetical protein